MTEDDRLIDRGTDELESHHFVGSTNPLSVAVRRPLVAVVEEDASLFE